MQHSIVIPNTKKTCLHYGGRLWLSRHREGAAEIQDIKVCYENEDGSLTAMSIIYRKSDGTYYHKVKNKDISLGTLDSPAFAEFAGSLQGLSSASAGETEPIPSREDLHQRVIALYKEHGSMKKIARDLHISEAQARKILLSNGVYRSELYDRIVALAAEGKSTQEIGEAVGKSPKIVRSYLPYI